MAKIIVTLCEYKKKIVFKILLTKDDTKRKSL